MVKIFGLDIPLGLEDAFFRIFQFGNNIDQSVLLAKSAVPTRQKKKVWNIKSLFVKWQGLYNGLSGSRHTAWTNYWLTLPFGSHVGAGGWPGSGFSAFVYVNAPRYRDNLDLLLDPPAFTELLLNGDFSAGGSDWVANNISFVSDHALFVPVGDYAEIDQTIDTIDYLIAGHTYRFSGFISSGAGSLSLFIQDGGGPMSGVEFYLSGGHSNFSGDHLADGSETDLLCAVYTEDGFDGYVDNLSFVDLGIL